MKINRMLFLAILFISLSIPTSARDLFYFLVGDRIETYDFNGVRQEIFQLGTLGSQTRRNAMTTDGNTAWFVFDPEDGHSWISGLAIRPGGSGRTINIDYSEYFFTSGLALGGDTLFLGRHRMPHPSYSPWFRIDSYSASTGGFGGKCTARTYPDHIVWVDGYLATIGTDATVHIYSGSCNFERSFDADSLYPGRGPSALAANNQTIWVFYYLIGNNNGHAFDWNGNRRADRDIVFQGLGTPTDGCLAWAPDKAIIRLEPASLNFGDLAEGNQKSIPLRIRNVGNLPLTISSITLSDTTNYAYPGPASTTIPAGSYIDTSVTFQPQAIGLFNASLAITSNDPDYASMAVPLNGEGRATVSYVDASRPASGSGTSWSTAFKTIADALTSPGVLDDTEIWIRQGTYTLPETLTVNKRIAIYGGFTGTETSRSERDWQNNLTTIDGNNAVLGLKISAANVTIDGLTVTRARNNAILWPDNDAGGISILASGATIQNCTITQCAAPNGFGGGIRITHAISGVRIRNCLIKNNSALYDGGGLFMYSANTEISDCEISGNSGRIGGGIYIEKNQSVSPIIRNCILQGNQASTNAGGICNSWTNSIIQNCLVSGNTQGGIYNYVCAAIITNCTIVDNSLYGIGTAYSDATPVITNCIVWNNTGTQIQNDSGANPAITYCDINQNGFGNTTTGEPDAKRNMRKAPRFIDPDGADNTPSTWQDNDYRLRGGSYGIDYGNGDVAPAEDLNGAVRHDDPGTENVGNGTPNYTDLGAYEFQGSTPDVIYVDGAAAGNHDGTSWADAFTTIGEGVDASGSGKEVWIREGMYILSAPIELNKHLSIYGGFDGTETLRDYRNAQKHIVTIDGNGAVPSCLIVRASTTIDGLTITGGTGTSNGGGIFIDQTSATIARCTFRDNDTSIAGGAIYANKGAVLISNCIFVNNHASQRGAAYTDWMSSLVMRNSLFAGNRCDMNGGALYIQRPSITPEIANCTFVDNRAGNSGGAIGLNEASVNIRSSILWGNTANFERHISVVISGVPSVEYCCIEGGGFALSNINVDPLFAVPGAWNDNGTPSNATDDTYSQGNYHLLSEHGRWDYDSGVWILDAQTSPCIDAGEPAGDWTAETWPSGRRINVGSYGGTWEASKSGPIGPDLTRNGWVDDGDMEVIAFSWLTDDPTCDIFPPGGDGIIDMSDFAAFAAAYSPEPEPMVIDFETGSFDTTYTWETGGSPGWNVINYSIDPDNQYHATSTTSVTPKYANSWLTLTLDPGTLNTLRFSYRMLNSDNRIKGEFFIDNVKIAGLTGKEWTQVQYALTPGTHTLKWVATNTTWMDATESMRLDDIRFFASVP